MNPFDHLPEGSTHGLELAAEHLVKRDPVPIERFVNLAVDLVVAERPGDLVEDVLLGDGAVEVDDERALAQGALTLDD